ncbi:MAG: glycosyltransferase family 9 protein, partial [Bacteroidota bacterium]
DEMTLLSGAGRTIAMSGNDESIHPGVRLKNNQRYGHVVEVPKSAHEGDRYSRLFTACGVGDLTAVDVLQEAVVQWKRSGRGAENTYDVVIAPGGSTEIRRWPTGRFRELVHRLRSSGIRQIAVCGSRDEYSLLESISAGLPDDVALLCGRPLMEIAATVQSASLIVGNENGILHLAAALRRPTVVIQGGGHFGRYFPNEAVRVVHHPLDCFGCNWRCPFPEAYCLTRISVDDVMTAFIQSWERRGKTA